jgi:hypothetical protein
MKNKLPIQIGEEKETIARLVQAYVDDSTILSERDKKMFDALCEADELQKDFGYPSGESRARELAKRRSISLTRARNLLKKAAEFFNQVDSVDPTTGARILLHQLDKLLNLCYSSNDFKQAAAFMKLKVQIYTEMVSNKPIDPTLLQQNSYTFNIGGKLRQEGERFTREELEEEMRRWKVSAREKKRIIQEVYPDDEP